ncbi:MAG TPA: TetR family transcriptional regulator [Acidimicrobiales bacterium]|nr:TetR family transcriptional regulator [Acidimicrobiales bacterium]
MAADSLRLPAARRRRQLLDVAVVRFAARGFHATSMLEIADAAGVTKPVLYQHFRSKRHLYLELLDDMGNQLMEAIGKATAAADGPRRQVEAGMAAYVRFMTEQPQAFPLLFGSGARRDPEFADAVRRVEDAIADAVAALIEADVDAVHRRVLAAAIVGMAEGVLRHWIADAPAVVPDLLVRQMAELAWAGLRGVRAIGDESDQAGSGSRASSSWR